MAVLEALLFSAPGPLRPEQLAALLGVGEAEAAAAVELLRGRYAALDAGLAVLDVAGGWQLATKPALADWVFRLHGHRKKSPVTPALLESLAIIAYKQPIGRAEVEAIRGVDCGGAVRSLLDAGLIESVGRKETPGRPSLYGTTELFLRTFGLTSLAELPMPGDGPPTLPRPAEGGA
ncbi:MAG: SMC-Scp complex subunit ScpB [Candidatus Sumerlaeia bacterium]|nr:SMC-Scp complex subunit ScpB [Candidatus Sumerlaeia bacterium]